MMSSLSAGVQGATMTYTIDTNEWRTRITDSRGNIAFSHWHTPGIAETTAGLWWEGKEFGGTVFCLPPADYKME